jgi:hypothetical protein
MDGPAFAVFRSGEFPTSLFPYFFNLPIKQKRRGRRRVF